MGCCKCEEYGWKDDPPLEVIWEDPANGKGYCIFHAPRGKKFKTLGGEDKYEAEGYNDCVKARMIKPFKGSFCFTGAIFPFPIKFCTTFYECEFSKCLFFSNAMFENCIFENTSYFQYCIFNDGFSFYKSKFKDSAHFTKASFCCFGKENMFYRCEFYGVAYFDRAIFASQSNFRGAEFFKRAYFRGSVFCDSVDFTDIYANKSSIVVGGVNSASIGKLVISKREVDSFSFFSVLWPKNYAPVRTDYGYEINLEELYRALKQKAAEEHDQAQVSRWHFREKLMYKKQRWYRRWLPLTLTWWYWATSGFGERAVRAGVWLLALVALSFLLNATPQPMDWNTLWGASAANATMATIPFAKDIPGDGWVKVGRGVWQFLIAVQFTLFALAVRNRFRR